MFIIGYGPCTRPALIMYVYKRLVSAVGICEIAGLSCTKCSVSAEHTCDDKGVHDPTMETLVRQKGDRTLFES